MGCFFPKKHSKVAQGDQQHGSKSDHMSNNKPVVLPDPDNLAREQSPRVSQGKNRITNGGKGGNDTLSQPGSGSNSSSRLIGQFPRALSAPHNYTFEDPGNSNGDGLYSSASATPFSAPLPSRLLPHDVTSYPLGASSSAPPTHGSSPLHYGTPPSGESVGEWRNGTMEKRSSFNERLDKKTFGGRPVRLPKPQSGGHPLPLPYSPDRSEVGSFVLSSAVASPIGASPSPSRGRDGYGSYSHALMGGHKSTDAKPLPPPALSSESRSPVRGFSYAELSQSFTPDFMLGDGVYGTVYRAFVDEGESKVKVAVVCPVAKSHKGQKEWIAEVNWLARLQDPHLCKLIGYCSEESAGQDGEVVPRRSRRLLVYEYLANGSLEKYLRDKADCQLDWSARMKIALDVAQGLTYLHDKAPFQVICRDLCPATVQLDKGFRAKLSGFGLARCGPEGDQGPPMAGPYAAPESSVNGVVTLKSNAWSFGVMLLELLTGRRHMDTTYSKDQQNLVQLTKPFLRDRGKLFLIVDSDLNNRYSLRGALKLANLAFQCLQKEASLRPNLSEAVEVLRTIQVDEDAVAADLKKSRSYSQSFTSPVNYSRSTSDILLRFNNNEGKNSSELKQRDREVQRTIAQPGSVGSSPSYSERRLSVDFKQREREFQRLGIQIGMVSSPSKDDTMGQSTESKQHERELQRLPTPAQTLSVTDVKKQLPDAKQIERELRKLATGSRLASKVMLNPHDGQKLHTSQPIDSIQSLDIRQHGQEAQKFHVPTQPLQPTESSEMKEQCSESETFHSPAGSVEEPRRSNDMEEESVRQNSHEIPTQSSEENPEGLGSSTPTASTPAPKQQVLEMQNAARPSAASRASCAPALIFDPPMLREAF